jgi:thiosulfate/3-mercaptopyruvate sulfurtransferase
MFDLAPLISAPELITLMAHPADQDLLVIDCRFNLSNPQAGEAAYQQGHIQGARYAHLDRDLSGPKTGSNGRHPMPSALALQATLRSWGISTNTRIVAYDDAGGMFAARLWWLLRWADHATVQVLDGGWPAWQAAQGPADAITPAERPASMFALNPRTDWVVSADTVLSRLHLHDDQLIIDARAPDRFRGENETMDPVGGHIPGARNRFFQLNLQADGRFKTPAQLQTEFDELLAQHDLTSVTHQCGSGVTACHNLLAMAHAGLPPTKLYAGSWSEWCADPSRPVER